METFKEWENTIVSVVEWLRLAVETIGIAFVVIGVIAALLHLVRSWKRHAVNFHETRLILARYLALTLEFLLGADILATAIAPSWDRIGQLAAIAVIRTGLNYFLMREMEETNTGKPRG